MPKPMTKKESNSKNDPPYDHTDAAQAAYQLPQVGEVSQSNEESVQNYNRGTSAPATTIMDIVDLKERRDAIRNVYENVMQEGTHYGKPFKGSDKKTLLKAGGEVLCATFMLSPKFVKTIRHLGDGHREIEFACHLFHIPSGKFVGEGWGSCSTMESKYRYRQAKLTCPDCQSEAIIKGKEEFGGGWVCWNKKGGCGKNFKDDDKRITDQQQGKVENPDIADEYNTVLKMAKKRAQIDGVLTVTGASEYFTQDLEDIAANQGKDFDSSSGKSSKSNSRSNGRSNPKAGKTTKTDPPAGRSGGNKQKKPKTITDQQAKTIRNFAVVLPEDRRDSLLAALKKKNPSYNWAKKTSIFLRAYDRLKAQYENFEKDYGKLPPEFWDTLEGSTDVGELTMLNDKLGEVIDNVADGAENPFEDVEVKSD